jgi:hypothetical protein
MANSGFDWQGWAQRASPMALPPVPTSRRPFIPRDAKSLNNLRSSPPPFPCWDVHHPRLAITSTSPLRPPHLDPPLSTYDITPSDALTYHTQTDIEISECSSSPTQTQNLSQQKSDLMAIRCQASPELSDEVLAKYRTLNEGWCQIIDARGNKGDRYEGYVQVSYGGCNHFALAHELALWSKGCFKWAQGLESSHLCHRMKCINKNHLVYEKKEMNQRRKDCTVWINCRCKERCKKKIMVCRHGPADGSARCIRFCPDWPDYNEFLKHGLHEEYDLHGPVDEVFNYIVKNRRTSSGLYKLFSRLCSSTRGLTYYSEGYYHEGSPWVKPNFQYKGCCVASVPGNIYLDQVT